MIGIVSVVVIAGLSLLLYPTWLVRVVKRDRPELNENDPRLFVIIRLIGVAFLIWALLVAWKNHV
jgi:hypothetical protein